MKAVMLKLALPVIAIGALGTTILPLDIARTIESKNT